MRIAILGIRGIPSGYSGYETFTQQVGPRLVERGHEVTVYCRRSLFKDRPKEYRGIKLVYLPSIQTKSLSTFSTCIAVMPTPRSNSLAEFLIPPNHICHSFRVAAPLCKLSQGMPIRAHSACFLSASSAPLITSSSGPLHPLPC